MTYTKPGRLYRKTEGIVTRPLFSLTVDDWPTHFDDAISSITIRRGNGDPNGGVGVSTMEVVIPEIVHFSKMTSRTIQLFMSSNRAQQLAAHTGYSDYTKLMNRFKGRIGPVSVEDTGKVTSSSTTFACSSWIAQEARSSHRATLTAPIHIDAALDLLLYRAPNYYTMAKFGVWDTLLETIENTRYSDTIGMLTSDYNVLVGDLRNGNARAMTLPYRLSQALARVTTTAPLTRSQAISPARWQQNSESNAKKWRVIRTDSTGARWTSTRYIEGQVAADAETVELDWEHFQERSDHWDYASRARVHQDNIRQYNLPGVKVDLLHLLGSEQHYHRRQAGELLALEIGDSLNLAGDWPAALQGIQIVTEMTETITGSEWTLDLSLAPLLHVFGEYPPDIPALVWEQATYPWDSESRRWNF